MRKGSHHTEKTKKKMSEARLKNPTRYWLGKRRLDIIGNQWNKGRTPWNKGKKGVMPTPWNKGIPCSEETKKKLKKASLGKHYSLETEFKKGHIMSKKTREKISIACKKATKQLWQGEKFRKKVSIGLKRRPTSLEKEMIKIIKKYKMPYKYVGDCSFRIGSKNPDFIHKNEKKLIEVSNTIHHSKKYPKKRSDYFAKYGWQSYIFRTNKLNEEKILEVLNA